MKQTKGKQEKNWRERRKVKNGELKEETKITKKNNKRRRRRRQTNVKKVWRHVKKEKKSV